MQVKQQKQQEKLLKEQILNKKVLKVQNQDSFFLERQQSLPKNRFIEQNEGSRVKFIKDSRGKDRNGKQDQKSVLRIQEDFFNPRKYFLNMDSSIVVEQKRKLSLGEKSKEKFYEEAQNNLRRKSCYGQTHGFLTSLEQKFQNLPSSLKFQRKQQKLNTREYQAAKLAQNYLSSNKYQNKLRKSIQQREQHEANNPSNPFLEQTNIKQNISNQTSQIEEKSFFTQDQKNSNIQQNPKNQNIQRQTNKNLTKNSENLQNSEQNQKSLAQIIQNKQQICNSKTNQNQIQSQNQQIIQNQATDQNQFTILIQRQIQVSDQIQINNKNQTSLNLLQNQNNQNQNKNLNCNQNNQNILNQNKNEFHENQDNNLNQNQNKNFLNLNLDLDCLKEEQFSPANKSVPNLQQWKKSEEDQIFGEDDLDRGLAEDISGLGVLVKSQQTPSHLIQSRMNKLRSKLRLAANLFCLRKRLEKDRKFFNKSFWVLSLIDDKQVNSMLEEISQKKKEEQARVEEERRKNEEEERRRKRKEQRANQKSYDFTKFFGASLQKSKGGLNSYVNQEETRIRNQNEKDQNHIYLEIENKEANSTFNKNSQDSENQKNYKLFDRNKSLSELHQINLQNLELLKISESKKKIKPPQNQTNNSDTNTQKQNQSIQNNLPSLCENSISYHHNFLSQFNSQNHTQRDNSSFYQNNPISQTNSIKLPTIVQKNLNSVRRNQLICKIQKNNLDPENLFTQNENPKIQQQQIFSLSRNLTNTQNPKKNKFIKVSFGNPKLKFILKGSQTERSLNSSKNEFSNQFQTNLKQRNF